LKKGRRKPDGAGEGEEPCSLALSGLVALLAFLLYLPSLGSGFVYDAEAQILIGDYLHEPAHFADVLTFRVLGQDVLDGNRPVQLASLMTDALLWGKRPVGYHLTSNLLHAANAGLLFLLLVALARGGKNPCDRRAVFPSAFTAALLFAVHPLLVEPVAEVSSREDLLAVFFVLAATLFGLRALRSAGRAFWGRGAACLLAVLLACGSKETGVVAPVLLLGCALLFREEGTGRRWALLVAAAFAVAGGFLALRFALQPEESKIFLHQPGRLGGSLAMTLEIQPRIWTFYLRQIFWPATLSADYTPQNVTVISKAWGYGVLGVFVLLQGLAAWKSRLALLGMAIFWAGLAPVSNLIPIYRPVADRYLYLPMAGLAMTVCGLLLFTAPRRKVFLSFLSGLAVVILILAALTWRRQDVFANARNLWADTLAASPQSDTAANNLGYALLEAGEHQAALESFDKAVRLTNGKKPNVWAGAAVTLEKMGRRREAVEALSRAIALEEIYANPDDLVQSLLMTRKQADVLKEILRQP
jgi:tetratricopeptide (TPR) repeat protein